MREQAICDYNSAMYGAHEQGLEQGREEGESERKSIEMAKVLLQNGVDINLIVTSSGLSQEEIEQFCKYERFINAIAV